MRDAMGANDELSWKEPAGRKIQVIECHVYNDQGGRQEKADSAGIRRNPKSGTKRSLLSPEQADSYTSLTINRHASHRAHPAAAFAGSPSYARSSQF